MIGELSILSEWIPEQMEPGTIFVLENAGEVGKKKIPIGQSCPVLPVDSWDWSPANRLGACYRSSADPSIARHSSLSATNRSCRASRTKTRLQRLLGGSPPHS